MSCLILRPVAAWTRRCGRLLGAALLALPLAQPVFAVPTTLVDKIVVNYRDDARPADAAALPAADQHLGAWVPFDETRVRVTQQEPTA